MHKSQELKGVTTRIAVMLQLVHSRPQIGHVVISGKLFLKIRSWLINSSCSQTQSSFLLSYFAPLFQEFHQICHTVSLGSCLFFLMHALQF